MLGVTANGMFQLHTRLFKSFLLPEKSVLVFLPLFLPLPNLIICRVVTFLRLSLCQTLSSLICQKVLLLLYPGRKLLAKFIFLPALWAESSQQEMTSKTKIKADIAVPPKTYEWKVKMFRIRKTRDQFSCTTWTPPSIKHSASHFRLLCIRQISYFSPINHRI